MRPVWTDVQLELDRIDDEEHAQFALATEKGPVHGYQSELRLVGVDAFAPCSFEGIDQFPDATDADERILITTTDNECVEPVQSLVDWQIIELEP
jgi:hypothetical protein